jgi:hypothetical protein
MSDPMIGRLGALPTPELDPARAERIRMRCRARLARQVARASASRVPDPPGKTAQVWQSLIAILGVVYLTEVISQALRLYRLP